MARNRRAWLFVGALALFAVSCAPVDRTRPQVAASFQLEPREGDDAIPLSYGRFVAATPVEGGSFQVVLWFEQEDGRIVGVRLNVGTGVAAGKVLVIPRR